MARCMVKWAGVLSEVMRCALFSVVPCILVIVCCMLLHACCTSPCHAMSMAMPYSTVPYCTMPHHTTPCHPTPHHAVRQCPVPRLVRLVVQQCHDSVSWARSATLGQSDLMWSSNYSWGCSWGALDTHMVGCSWGALDTHIVGCSWGALDTHLVGCSWGAVLLYPPLCVTNDDDGC